MAWQYQICGRVVSLGFSDHFGGAHHANVADVTIAWKTMNLDRGVEVKKSLNRIDFYLGQRRCLGRRIQGRSEKAPIVT